MFVIFDEVFEEHGMILWNAVLVAKHTGKHRDYEEFGNPDGALTPCQIKTFLWYVKNNCPAWFAGKFDALVALLESVAPATPVAYEFI